jgi:hypothetical protein
MAFNQLITRNSDISFQYKAYQQNIPFTSYTTYDSQIGGEGIFFSILNKIIPLSPNKKLKIFHIYNALLAALVIALACLWFYREIGLPAGVFALISIIFSTLMISFAKNLEWSTWAFFLPLLLMMFYLKRYGLPSKQKYFSFGALVAAVVLIKSIFNGYEFITTTLIMMVVPFIFYSFMNKITWRTFLNLSLVITISTGLAILLSFIILSVQIAFAEGTIQNGINHIIYVLLKRTYGDPESFPKVFRASLRANPLNVLQTYLQAIYCDFHNFISNKSFLSPLSTIQIRYWHLIVIFAIITFLLVFFKDKDNSKGHKILSLVVATWFSILAPLSWFIIFKGHAYIHTPMDPIVWQMPFTIFGFSLCGVCAQRFLGKLIRQFNFGKRGNTINQKVQEIL